MDIAIGIIILNAMTTPYLPDLDLMRDCGPKEFIIPSAYIRGGDPELFCHTC